MTHRSGSPFRHAFSVPPDAIDGQGHVNNVVYVQWMQDVAVMHFEALGGVEPMRAVGAMWVARSHHVEYLAPAFADDTVEALTWIESVSRVRSLRQYEFHNLDDGRLLARGETDWVLVKEATGRPMTVPVELRSLMAGGSS